MAALLWGLFWLVAAAAFIGITAYLIFNIIALRKADVSSFEGEPVEADAVVSEQSLEYFSTVRSAPAAASEHINTVTLKYVADGITFTKEASLIDVHERLKAGDTVKLYYDSLNSGRAVLADGSEAKSAKNGIKWSVGYYVILLIVGAFMFLKIADVVG